ncbi:M48 family metalloprotease [Rhodobacterales bacterium HKCCE2091]|nr:M48 family metalloprotease [Rhodobacterales bacterium HKCCE2091]
MRIVRAVLALILLAATAHPGAAQSSRQEVLLYVVGMIEPVAEAECRRRLSGGSCDFQFFVEPNARTANAYQSIDDHGRPIVVVSQRLVQQARTADDLAFVLSHEAAHHMLRHLDRLNAGLAAGGDRTLPMLGAGGGSAGTSARTFELEADRLGARIMARAGFDPNLGVRFLSRLPGIPSQGTATHPSHAERAAAVAALGL